MTARKINHGSYPEHKIFEPRKAPADFQASRNTWTLNFRGLGGSHAVKERLAFGHYAPASRADSEHASQEMDQKDAMKVPKGPSTTVASPSPFGKLTAEARGAGRLRC